MTTKISKNNSAPTAKDRPKKPETSQPKNESQVLLANALGQIEKTFGKGSIMKLSEEGTGFGVQGISSRRQKYSLRKMPQNLWLEAGEQSR